jgi:hypothetical protein
LGFCGRANDGFTDGVDKGCVKVSKIQTERSHGEFSSRQIAFGAYERDITRLMG